MTINAIVPTLITPPSSVVMMLKDDQSDHVDAIHDHTVDVLNDKGNVIDVTA
jgi:hypothetical protein